MIKIAVYGKGGIGKSTTVSNLSAAFSESGLTVMQIGCDPKADSTIKLLGGRQPATVLDMMRAKGAALELGDIVTAGYGGVLCVEAGGPPPGLGCAGRGIIAAIEKLEEKGAFAFYKPDVVLYDVLGDVVCGGFAMPIREGYARDVFVMTSGENMAIHAAANIAAAVGNFASRGYARLSGVILNRRNVDREEEKVKELAEDIHSRIVGELDFSREVQKADEAGTTAMEMFPGGDAAKMYRKLAKSLLAVCGDEK